MPIVLKCPNLVEALDIFTGRLGFRIEMIVPADSPRIAVLSGHGVTLRLEAETDATAAIPDDSHDLIGANDTWNEGRAAMLYRDLIPGRLGGRFIASHIRIPDGGETPDYVHYHKIQFQMIYCKAGWARVVYEDQGRPFILQAGDCILQPPEIRHRVLETSPGLEVIEIACPAVHETHADHELQLPTSRVMPERLFANQRFVHDRASEATWASWILAGLEVRDTRIALATGGIAAARVIRSSTNSGDFEIQHAGGFFFLFVLKGELTIDNFEKNLKEGDSCVLPSGYNYRMRANAGLELLEVRLPAACSDE
jgi:mannose-6-phosphate isomerase-like protein (cupin superfamily)